MTEAESIGRSHWLSPDKRSYRKLEVLVRHLSDNVTNRDLALSARAEYTVSHPDAISPGFALVINSLCRGQEGRTMRHKVGQFGLPVEGYGSYSSRGRPPR